MSKRFPLTKKQFSEFVHAKPNRRYHKDGVAYSRMCPLARALTELAPKSKDGQTLSWNVSASRATGYDGEAWSSEIVAYYDLPQWASNFVLNYDLREKGQKATDFI